MLVELRVPPHWADQLLDSGAKGKGRGKFQNQ